jgi:hypothetical protein
MRLAFPYFNLYEVWYSVDGSSLSVAGTAVEHIERDSQHTLVHFPYTRRFGFKLSGKSYKHHLARAIASKFSRRGP